MPRVRTAFAAVTALLLVVSSSAQGGVILVSQDRYTREQFQQKSRITGEIISQSDVTNPADGFLPFTDTVGGGRQTSTVSTTALVASGQATGGASGGTSTTSWSLGTSQYKVIFDVVGEPQDYQWVETTPTAQTPFAPVTLNGPTSRLLPYNSTTTGTLPVGRWTLTILDSVGGEGFGSPGMTFSYNGSLTFVPEPSAAALGALCMFPHMRRRRRCQRSQCRR